MRASIISAPGPVHVFEGVQNGLRHEALTAQAEMYPVAHRQGKSLGCASLGNGWLWTQTLANAATTMYTYNAPGEVTDLAHRRRAGTPTT